MAVTARAVTRTAPAAASIAGSPESGLSAPARDATRVWRVTGVRFPGLDDFDDAVMRFMQERSIAAGSLAVTRHGRLLLARGYTWSADPALWTQPTSLFRTASITKPVTATVILRLMQDGRLRPADRAADILRLPTSADPRLADVTVLRLMQHLGGWDRGLSYDPMFSDAMIARDLGLRLPIGRDDIVAHVTMRPLDHAPGTAFAYSNYGYLLLGKIIEKLTGASYADHVGRTVLAPLGITRMRLGGTLVRAAHEMPYFSQFSGTTVMDGSGARVAGPYGTFNYENNAFNCGWLASAVDLTRFAAIYDGGTPVLSPDSVARAFAVPEIGRAKQGRYYSCGWHVRPLAGRLDAMHTGSLPGTHTLLVRRGDGLTWAAMFDQRDDPSREKYRDLDPALHAAADAMGEWPSGDLGAAYFTPHP